MISFFHTVIIQLAPPSNKIAWNMIFTVIIMLVVSISLSRVTLYSTSYPIKITPPGNGSCSPKIRSIRARFSRQWFGKVFNQFQCKWNRFLWSNLLSKVFILAWLPYFMIIVIFACGIQWIEDNKCLFENEWNSSVIFWIFLAWLDLSWLLCRWKANSQWMEEDKLSFFHPLIDFLLYWNRSITLSFNC